MTAPRESDAPLCESCANAPADGALIWPDGRVSVLCESCAAQTVLSVFAAQIAALAMIDALDGAPVN